MYAFFMPPSSRVMKTLALAMAPRGNKHSTLVVLRATLVMVLALPFPKAILLPLLVYIGPFRVMNSCFETWPHFATNTLTLEEEQTLS